jgi:hypothetical protein
MQPLPLCKIGLLLCNEMAARRASVPLSSRPIRRE